MTAPIALHLMRHGEPSLAGTLLGKSDVPVTDAGVARCREAAHGLMVETVVTSDLRRATACGDAVAAMLGAPVRIDPRWRELDFGAWDGLRPDEIDPAALTCFHADPDRSPPPGGERWSALVARVSEAIATIDRPALVVAHGGSMRAALAASCGFDSRQVWAFDLPYACVLTLALWPGAPPAAQICGLAS